MENLNDLRGEEEDFNGVSWERCKPGKQILPPNSPGGTTFIVPRFGGSDQPPAGPDSGQDISETMAIPGGHLEQLLDGMPPAGATAEQENKKPAGERWQPQALNARHREIMRRLLEGANYLTIAEEMGMHHQTVMLVATSEIFKTEMRKLAEAADFTVIRRADDLANEALDNLKIIMRHSRSDAHRRAASMDILGIAGYSKIEKKIVGIVSAEDVIKEIQARKRSNDPAPSGSNPRLV